MSGESNINTGLNIQLFRFWAYLNLNSQGGIIIIVETTDTETPLVETLHATSLPLFKLAVTYGHIIMNINIKRPVD
jgi:hypothetical protein